MKKTIIALEFAAVAGILIVCTGCESKVQRLKREIINEEVLGLKALNKDIDVFGYDDEATWAKNTADSILNEVEDDGNKYEENLNRILAATTYINYAGSYVQSVNAVAWGYDFTKMGNIIIDADKEQKKDTKSLIEASEKALYSQQNLFYLIGYDLKGFEYITCNMHYKEPEAGLNGYRDYRILYIGTEMMNMLGLSEFLCLAWNDTSSTEYKNLEAENKAYINQIQKILDELSQYDALTKMPEEEWYEKELELVKLERKAMENAGKYMLEIKTKRSEQKMKDMKKMATEHGRN